MDNLKPFREDCNGCDSYIEEHRVAEKYLIDKPINIKYYTLLYDIEGNVFHKNETEEFITTPYGVYIGANRNFIKNWISGRSINELNRIFKTSKKFRTQFRKELFNLISTKYINVNLIKALDDRNELVFFAYSWNVGLQTAIKHLQEYLEVEQDGIVGPITLSAIKKKEDISLKSFFSDKYKGFKNYKLYAKSWNRRLKVAYRLG